MKRKNLVTLQTSASIQTGIRQSLENICFGSPKCGFLFLLINSRWWIYYRNTHSCYLDLLRVLLDSQESHCLWLIKARCLFLMKSTYLSWYHFCTLATRMFFINAYICTYTYIYMYVHMYVHICILFQKKILNMQIFPTFIVIWHFCGFLWWLFSPASVPRNSSTKYLNHHHSAHSLSDYHSYTKPKQKSKPNSQFHILVPDEIQCTGVTFDVFRYSCLTLSSPVIKTFKETIRTMGWSGDLINKIIVVEKLHKRTLGNMHAVDTTRQHWKIMGPAFKLCPNS